jgi:hypothetical protein
VTVDLDRLIVRLAIWQEAAQLAEYRHSLAMEAAEYLVAPRVKLADEARRIVRVLNAPPEARRNKSAPGWHPSSLLAKRSASAAAWPIFPGARVISGTARTALAGPDPNIASATERQRHAKAMRHARSSSSSAGDARTMVTFLIMAPPAAVRISPRGFPR